MGIRSFNIIKSFLGSTQNEETFMVMSRAFRGSKTQRIIYERRVRYGYNMYGLNCVYHRPESPEHFLFSERTPVQKYAIMIADLEASTEYYSSEKDNAFILRLINERKREGSFIFNFR